MSMKNPNDTIGNRTRDVKSREDVKTGLLCLTMEKAHTLWTYRYEQTHFEFILKWYKKSGHVVRVGEERGVYRVLVGKPDGKKPLGRPRRRWVDNIRMDLQEVECGYMD